MRTGTDTLAENWLEDWIDGRERARRKRRAIIRTVKVTCWITVGAWLGYVAQQAWLSL